MLRDNKKSVYLGVVVLLACFCSGMLQVGESFEERRQYVDSKKSMRGSNTAKSRPLFVLHVGPPKTGTTSIQHFANTSQELLRQDNFYYLGTTNMPKTKHLHELVRNCRDGVHPDCKTKWDEFKGIVRRHLQQNHNVLMSEEMLNICRSPEEEQEYLWDNLMPLFAEGWDVRILFTYRHLHDWIPSKYHQSTNFKVIPRKRPVVENWPDHGGRVIGSFVKFYDEFMERPFHLPLPVKKRWDERFSDIRVFDMDNSTDNLLQDFFCQVMPEAERLCRYLTDNNIVAKHVNPSSEHVVRFDMLAVAAYQQHWIDDSLARKDVSYAAELHAQEIGYAETTDFPLECLSTEKNEELFQHSLEYAQEMFPRLYSSTGGKEDLRAAFEEGVEAGKFCTVDIEETLNEPKWRKFFKSLTSNNIRPEDSS